MGVTHECDYPPAVVAKCERVTTSEINPHTMSQVQYNSADFAVDMDTFHNRLVYVPYATETDVPSTRRRTELDRALKYE